MKTQVINAAVFQAGWFACVLGAANGYPLLGLAVVAAGIALHLRLAVRPGRELQLLILAGIFGAVFDTLLVRTGWLTYPNGQILANTAPYWIVAMWLIFATTLNVSMRWLRERRAMALLFGAVGGPLSYIAGARLGGLEFVNQSAALIALAVGWGLVTPLLCELSRQYDGFAPSSAGARHA